MNNNIRKPKVLVTTVGSWSSRSGSDTMSSLMQKYGAENVAALYIRADKSDSKSASRYFQIMEGRVMKSILHPSIVTGEEFRPENIMVTELSADQEAEKARYSLFSKHRWGIFIFAREFVWKLGHWKSEELNAFLEDFKPEVLICPIESYIHFNTINEYIIKKCNPRVIGFLWDDNFTYKQDHSLWHQLHRFWLRRSVKRMVAKCNTIFCLSPKMKEECDKEFGVESKLLTKPIFNQGVFKPYEVGTPIKILYTGKLIIGRDETIAEVVDAIKIINKDRQRVMLEVFTNTELNPAMEERINVPGCCNLHDSIPQKEVFAKQSEADVLLFAESLSEKKLTARLSFSTKLTDYFSAGKCIWGIGNKDLSSIEYLKSQDAAVVSTNKNQILDTLSQLVDNPFLIGHYARKAYDCGIKNHSAVDILGRLYAEIRRI